MVRGRRPRGRENPQCSGQRKDMAIHQEAWLGGMKTAPLIKFLPTLHKSPFTLIKRLFNLWLREGSWECFKEAMN